MRHPTLAPAALLLCLAASVHAQSATAPAPGEKTVSLPLRQVSVYKNGVALFEQSGQVTGDTLIQIDFTTAELDDVLQSITAVDRNGGTIAGLGFDSSASVSQQLQMLGLRLGPDPTVLEFLHAIKGQTVEVQGPAGTLTGKVLNVEVHTQPDAKTGILVEHRILSLVTKASGLRSIELTPSVEVRLTGATQKQEIGRYLQLLATTRDPDVRHLILEAKGSGERTVEISYLKSVPAWKSSYRVLLNSNSTSGTSSAATLQGWAIVDNTSAQDWDNVTLTLVSGAPRSFIQQLSRPNNIVRPEFGLHAGLQPRAQLGAPHHVDLISPNDRASVAVDATAIGGGLVTQISAVAKAPVPTPTAPSSAEDEESAPVAVSTPPVATAVALSDLFEYKLSQPITIHRNQSAVIPILQTPIQAERVSVWHDHGLGTITRALWIGNTGNLTLDEGSFSILEDGVFDGQGQIALLHTGKRWLAIYGTDDEVKVSPNQLFDPATDIRKVVICNGTITVHRRSYKSHEYTVHNTGNSPRTVVLEIESQHRRDGYIWKLQSEPPAVEKFSDTYRFLVQVDPNSSKVLPFIESHAHPNRYQLASMKIDELQLILKQAKDDPDLVAALEPILAARQKIADLDKDLKETQRQMAEIAAEESRIRQNISTLKGTAEEKPLAKRYTADILTQENKLAAVTGQRESDRRQRAAAEDLIAAQSKVISANITIPTS